MVKDLKKRALHRTRILQGQIRGLEKMIESEHYCIDILTQSLAIQKSMRSLNKLILKNHLETHVPQAFQKGSKGKGIAIKELLDIYELSSVRN